MEERPEYTYLNNLEQCNHCKDWFEKELIQEYKGENVCIDCKLELTTLSQLQELSDQLFFKADEFQNSTLKIEFRELVTRLNAKILKYTI